jgi:hypothetical protein
LGDLLFERLTTAGYPPKAMQKRGQTVLYYKESEQIEDLLTMTGAASCALELIEQKIYKDLRNRANRATNCETANIDKLVRASQSQLDDILFLKTSGGLQALPAELIFMARLREENPTPRSRSWRRSPACRARGSTTGCKGCPGPRGGCAGKGERRTMNDFVHLHLHTQYSLLDGACVWTGCSSAFGKLARRRRP